MRAKLSIAAAALISLAVAAQSQTGAPSAAPTAAGLWQAVDDDTKQDAEHPEKFVDGTILDPRDGKVYKATMTVSPDGQTLTVRGYVGFSLLGKNVYWTRLPDSAMTMLDPAVNPNPAVATPAAKPAPARKPQAAPAAAAPAPAPDSGLRR